MSKKTASERFATPAAALAPREMTRSRPATPAVALTACDARSVPRR